MPLNGVLRKVSGKKTFQTLEEFETQLKIQITELEHKLVESREMEENYKEKYNERISKLDISGSKQAIERGREKLAESLEFDVQLEFLRSIQKLCLYFQHENIKDPKHLQNFNNLANKILSRKKIKSRVNRQIFIKRFKKFVSINGDEILIDKESSEITELEDDIEKILKEVEDQKKSKDPIDDEVEKIINEIKGKKRQDS